MARAKNPEKGIPKTAKIHPDTVDALERLAKKDSISLSAMIDKACTSYAKRRGEIKVEPAAA